MSTSCDLSSATARMVNMWVRGCGLIGAAVRTWGSLRRCRRCRYAVHGAPRHGAAVSSFWVMRFQKVSARLIVRLRSYRLPFVHHRIPFSGPAGLRASDARLAAVQLSSGSPSQSGSLPHFPDTGACHSSGNVKLPELGVSIWHRPLWPWSFWLPKRLAVGLAPAANRADTLARSLTVM